MTGRFAGDRLISRPIAWVAGLAALAAGLLQLALFGADGVGIGERTLVAAWNLAQVPLALGLWLWLRPRGRAIVDAATGCGLASLLLWAGSALVPSLTQFEGGWIGLSAAWWLGIGAVLRAERRTLGLLTIVLGCAAIGDAIVTIPEMLGHPLPEVVWVVLGGWKVPLSIAWTIMIGISLLIRPPSPGAAEPQLA